MCIDRPTVKLLKKQKRSWRFARNGWTQKKTHWSSTSLMFDLFYVVLWKMTEVTPGVFVGSLDEAFDRRLLEESEITHILNVASEVDIKERVNRVYLKVAVDDDSPDANMANIMDECLTFIQSGLADGGKVLVHCLEGKSRSVCVVLAHMMSAGINCWDECLEHIRCIRPHIDIYPLYLLQTRQYTERSQPS